MNDDEFYEFYLDDHLDILLLVKSLNKLLKKTEGKEKRLLVHVCFEDCRSIKISKKGKRKRK
ncbi:MAG: hypothetical protein Q7J54_00205 [Candidatus Woesearchaeota archaeon]|nr:hypothetical protein [Candidatus Woesearchaeota archaeon]